MNSLEWRTRKLENKIFGYTGANLRQKPSHQDEPIVDQLNQVSELYKRFLKTGGEKYIKFLELYKEIKDISKKSENERTDDISHTAKAELVLAYEDELTRHMESVNTIAEKTNRVLDIKNWPDFRGYTERLDKLQTITRDQHLQSVNLDKRTEELIEVYNEIITSFKSNCSLWNQKLDAYENEEETNDDANQ